MGVVWKETSKGLREMGLVWKVLELGSHERERERLGKRRRRLNAGNRPNISLIK